jgi:colicin import membrane protein
MGRGPKRIVLGEERGPRAARRRQLPRDLPVRGEQRQSGAARRFTDMLAAAALGGRRAFSRAALAAARGEPAAGAAAGQAAPARKRAEAEAEAEVAAATAAAAAAAAGGHRKRARAAREARERDRKRRRREDAAADAAFVLRERVGFEERAERPPALAHAPRVKRTQAPEAAVAGGARAVAVLAYRSAKAAARGGRAIAGLQRARALALSELQSA